MSELDNFLQAAREGDLSFMKWVVDNEFDSHQTNEVGRNALYFAASGGQVEVIEWLVTTQNFDVNYADMHGERALHVAAIEGQYDALEWMLEHGAIAEVEDNFGISPLQRAARISVDMVDLLLLHGADIDHIDNDGLTALHYSMLSRVGSSIIFHLISHGADIYDNHGEIIFSQIDRYYAEDYSEEYYDSSSEEDFDNHLETHGSTGIYAMLYDTYALNQLPGYIDPCL